LKLRGVLYVKCHGIEGEAKSTVVKAGDSADSELVAKRVFWD